MKNSILVSILVLVLMAACSTDRETVSGQKFTVLKKGDGNEIAARKIMVMDFLFKDSKDSLWWDTRNTAPQIMQKQAKPQGGGKLMEVIGMLSKGDSVVLKMSAADLFLKSFGGGQIPPKVDSTSIFTFYIVMKEVLDSAQFDKFRTDLMAKQNEKMLKQQQEQLAKDTVIIDAYLKEKNITSLKTSAGLRYVITKPGKGDNARDGQTASVNYAGYLLNGKYFDTNIEAVAKEKNIFRQGKYAVYDVTIGKSQVIQGWHEALRLMNKGSKMTVFIPSTLAYGSRRRSEDIIENSVLAFDLEVVDIK